MKILSNKKYNELILKPLQGCFAQVDDDQLLRENGMLYAENKKLKDMLKSFYELLQRSKGFYCLKEFVELDKWYKENILGSDKE